VELNGCQRVRLRESINQALVGELHAAIDRAEGTPGCGLLVLEGDAEGVFCTGMDLAEAARDGSAGHAEAARGGAEFLGLLKRMASTPVVVVSAVDGRVAGGGVGLAAASDFVYATPRSQFSLPEALWGLLPACVAPFLIRRVGFQRAYAMTLSTLPVTADRAAACQLVDEVADDLGVPLRRLAFRLGKVAAPTVAELKRYFTSMWILGGEMERAAVDEFARLMTSDRVRGAITDYALRQRLPWEG
jgi:polyketide biosynthesis enoyl-CoA hydratase PksH